MLLTLQWVDLWENWDRGIRQLLEVMSGSSPSYHYLRSGLQSTSDPYAGATNAQLFEQIAQLTDSGQNLDVAKRHEEAADFFARAIRIWESIEARRLHSVDRNQFLIDSFATHFNLTLSLFKSHQRLRASNEAVKAAKRYGALLRSGESTISPEVQQAAEVYAEVLMSIGRELRNATPESQSLEGCRVYCEIPRDAKTNARGSQEGGYRKKVPNLLILQPGFVILCRGGAGRPTVRYVSAERLRPLMPPTGRSRIGLGRCPALPVSRVGDCAAPWTGGWRRHCGCCHRAAGGGRAPGGRRDRRAAAARARSSGR